MILYIFFLLCSHFDINNMEKIDDEDTNNSNNTLPHDEHDHDDEGEFLLFFYLTSN